MTQELENVELLRSGEFRKLMVRLGWDHPKPFDPVELDGKLWRLEPVAEKRGVRVLLCPPETGGAVLDRKTRLRLEKRVARVAAEHIIIYADGPKTTQLWQWVRREHGKPDRPRELTLLPGHTGAALLQRLQAITFALDEETKLDLAAVTGRIRAAFDVDRVTRRFYDQFKTEHDQFLKFIEGITDQGDREWYASVMLNRLMFVYFIQKKRFLNNDPDYLRNRLEMIRRLRGPDEFLSFYRYFLLRLFHEGLGQKAASRDPELEQLLGMVPYLNGGLFDPHELEKKYDSMDIPDDAFTRIFNFFDQWEWTLDIRPTHPDNEINPTCSVTSSRSTSTRNRWGRTTRRRTSPATSPETR